VCYCRRLKSAIRLKSKNCELLFNDKEQYAEIDAGGHKIRIDCKDDKGRINIMTVKEHLIDTGDKDGEITVKTSGGNVINMIIL
jgi:hypothetical protein